MDSNKNIITIKPHEIYNKYTWKFLINDSYHQSGLLLRFLWKQFGKWTLEKKLIIGTDHNTKIFWLDTILSYLCYEFPCIDSIEGHNKPINSIILMDTNIIISGDDEGIMLVNDLTRVRGYQCIRKLKSELNCPIKKIIKLDNVNIISENLNKTGSILHLLWDASKNNYIHFNSQCTENVNGMSIFKVNDNELYTRTYTKLINWEIYRLHDYNARFRVFLNQYKLNKYGRENSRKNIKHENVNIMKRKSSNLQKNKIYLLKLDNNKIIIGNDNILEIWDIREHNINSLIRSLSGHKKRITCCIKLKKNIIVSSDESNKIYVWNLKTQDREACINILEGHTGKITSLNRMNKDVFVSSSVDKTIRIWNLKILEGNKCIKILKGHNESVNTILVKNDTTIISGGSDNKLLIWDLKNFI